MVAARGFGSHISSPLWLLVVPGYSDVRCYVGTSMAKLCILSVASVA